VPEVGWNPPGYGPPSKPNTPTKADVGHIFGGQQTGCGMALLVLTGCGGQHVMVFPDPLAIGGQHTGVGLLLPDPLAIGGQHVTVPPDPLAIGGQQTGVGLLLPDPLATGGQHVTVPPDALATGGQHTGTTDEPTAPAGDMGHARPGGQHGGGQDATALLVLNGGGGQHVMVFPDPLATGGQHTGISNRPFAPLGLFGHALPGGQHGGGQDEVVFGGQMIPDEGPLPDDRGVAAAAALLNSTAKASIEATARRFVTARFPPPAS
jgi:hypothetical protein